MFYWMMFFLAIITEVIGTSTMKFISEYAPVKDQLFLFVAI
ncbi:multidrug transporter EmrE-like cation transporter [Sporomusaceae bacterium BoRhaA]|nr:hypothetical protein [Pelorhabdus rhamnosifermentans]MBU2700740.1 multidrug transporter EmrE-like cation transporter [Pelorhabdus rhamnosifermentans]